MGLNCGDEIVSRKYGRCVIEKVISTGLFAEAYEVSARGVTYFFKKYSEPSTLFSKWYKGYESYQAQLLSKLDKPEVKNHVVSVLETFVYDDFYCQLHEWNPNPDLESFISKLNLDNKSDQDMALNQAIGIAIALNKVHEAGVIHTDLKPQNIASTSDSTPLIADFDWSILPGQAHPWDGGVRGTPFYMSYEHMYSIRLVKESDIFTYGIIAYELLAGVNPLKALLGAGTFTNEEMYAKLKPLLNNVNNIPTPLELNSKCGLTENVSNALRKTLSANYKDRPSLLDLAKIMESKSVSLVLKHSNEFELRLFKNEVANGKNYLGRETCRLFPNAKQVSRLHAWLMPSPDYSKWFAIPSKRLTTNILYIVRGGREEKLVAGCAEKEIKPGDVLRIRGGVDNSIIVNEWVVEFRAK